MITLQQLNQIPHITPHQNGNPAFSFDIEADEGYFIHLTTWDNDEELSNVYKTFTAVYPDDDINIIQVVAEADLPTDAHICGDVKIPAEEAH